MSAANSRSQLGTCKVSQVAILHFLTLPLPHPTPPRPAALLAPSPQPYKVLSTPHHLITLYLPRNYHSMSLSCHFHRTLTLNGRGQEETHNEAGAFLLGWFQELERSTEQKLSEFYLPTIVDLSSFDPGQELPGPVQHRFFRPWPLARLEEHEKNDQKPEETEQLFRMEAILHSPNMRNERRAPESITWERTRLLCSRLVHEVQTFPRNGTKGNRLALKHLTGWRHGEFVLLKTISLCLGDALTPFISRGLPFDYDLQSEFAEVWAPGRTKLVFEVSDSWTLGRDIPHVKLSMFHEASAENGVILRSELLAIMAIMITRLRMDSLKKHTIIPVSLASVTVSSSNFTKH